jgi:hypothetical protein
MGMRQSETRRRTTSRPSKIRARATNRRDNSGRKQIERSILEVVEFRSRAR